MTYQHGRSTLYHATIPHKHKFIVEIFQSKISLREVTLEDRMYVKRPECQDAISLVASEFPRT